MMRTILKVAAIAAGLNGVGFGSAAAQGLPDDIVHATLRGGWQTASGSQMTALHLTLAPGWKTYWRAPGDSGIPPRFDWSGSENIAGVTFHWPIPEVFDLNGLRTIGYKHELVLPIELHPVTVGKPFLVAAEVQLGVCEEICVPISLTLTAQPDASAKQDPVISAALAHAPQSAAQAGLTAARCAAEPIRDGLRLTAGLTLPQLGPREFAVIELADETVWVSPADTERSGGQLTAVSDLVPPNAQPFALDRSSVRITVFGGSGRVVDLQGCTG
ncbi:MAG: protein-disulfide reductase DsbD domain-containing protein [Albidovulum sp.]